MKYFRPCSQTVHDSFDRSTLSGAVGGRAPKVIWSQFCKFSKDLSFHFVGSRAPCMLRAQTAGVVRDWHGRMAGEAGGT